MIDSYAANRGKRYSCPVVIWRMNALANCGRPTVNGASDDVQHTSRQLPLRITAVVVFVLVHTEEVGCPTRLPIPKLISQQVGSQVTKSCTVDLFCEAEL